MGILENLSEFTRLCQEHGLPTALEATIRKYRKVMEVEVGAEGIQTVPIILLNQLHLLATERSIAIPTSEGYWRITGSGQNRKIPVLDEKLYQTRHGSYSHQKMLEKMYQYPRFVELEESDVVVETGAYVGGFTLMTAETAKEVIAVEPSEKEDSYLSYNTRLYDNISIIPVAAWDKSERVTLNTSYFPNDNSLITPDDNPTGKEYRVEAKPLSEIMFGESIDYIDYLKIEAEGVEPDILSEILDSGIGVNKIAVDVVPERYDESPINEVIRILEEHNYNWKRKPEEEWWGENIVFGKPANQ